MEDLITVLGLVFVIEGSLLTLFPDRLKKMMVFFMALPLPQLRGLGLALAVFGFAVVWLVRGL